MSAIEIETLASKAFDEVVECVVTIIAVTAPSYASEEFRDRKAIEQKISLIGKEFGIIKASAQMKDESIPVSVIIADIYPELNQETTLSITQLLTDLVVYAERHHRLLLHARQATLGMLDSKALQKDVNELISSYNSLLGNILAFRKSYPRVIPAQVFAPIAKQSALIEEISALKDKILRGESN
ncbi:hypothetical protein HY493_03900 [Candidatus Woesearchaeota archaeon]|nr:hypothetical protein [Candidatus Woesearchaeota archaeon]